VDALLRRGRCARGLVSGLHFGFAWHRYLSGGSILKEVEPF
jgi:hypothetical protein